MERNTIPQVYVLEKSESSPFAQRESGIAHTAYGEEKAFYRLVKNGDAEGIKRKMGEFVDRSLVVGRLSDSPLLQARYWAVCCVTLGTRYAIEGGLPEPTAYNLSDSYIRQIDKLNDADDIVRFLADKVVELAQLVADKAREHYPPDIRSCLDHIDKHTHETIDSAELAAKAGYSKEYFFKYFKKNVGVTMKQYILDKKLEEAAELLSDGYGEEEVAYCLEFCSQTYFITRFKKKYGITPHKYAKAGRK